MPRNISQWSLKVFPSKVGFNLPIISSPSLITTLHPKRRQAHRELDLPANPTSPQNITSEGQTCRKKVLFATGTYILRKTIGQGSIGKVKVVRHERTGELVSTRRARLRPNLQLTEVQCAV